MRLALNGLDFWNIKKNIFIEFCNIARISNFDIFHNYKNKMEMDLYKLNFISSSIISELIKDNRHLEVVERNLSSLNRMVNNKGFFI